MQYHIPQCNVADLTFHFQHDLWTQSNYSHDSFHNLFNYETMLRLFRLNWIHFAKHFPWQLDSTPWISTKLNMQHVEITIFEMFSTTLCILFQLLFLLKLEVHSIFNIQSE